MTFTHLLLTMQCKHAFDIESPLDLTLKWSYDLDIYGVHVPNRE